MPWDSRAAEDATLDDLSETLVREHLRASGSALVEEPDRRTIYRKMDIVRRINDREVPRNAGLLFFSREPGRWFPGARIETSILRAGAGGDVLEEKDFRGGLAEQVRGCLAYLRREVIGSAIHRAANGVRASRRPSYPEEALREGLVNAFGAAGPAILNDPRALLESARNKLWLAGSAHREGRTGENRLLLEDARTLLERLLGMEATPRRHAWAWRELGRVRRWLREPASAVDEAYANAIRLVPDETNFREERRQWR